MSVHGVRNFSRVCLAVGLAFAGFGVRAAGTNENRVLPAETWRSGALATQPFAFPSEDRLGALDQWLQNAAQRLGGAGLSVGFSLGDFQWMGSYGQRDAEKQLPVTPDTSFRIASVSKIMTAIAVLQQVERGTMQLDAPIQEYVPSFPMKRWPVRVRDLLGHLSGISHYRNCRRECFLQRHYTTEQSLALFQQWPLAFQPGEEYLYTSYGYNLLAAAVEKSAHLSFEKYLQRHIFQPAGMVASSLERNDPPAPEKARGYELVETGLRPSRPVNIASRFGGGAVRSTQRDMLRFGRALLTEKLLSDTMTAQMQQSMATTSGVLTDYGMGIGVFPQSGRYVLAHAGGQPETSTLFLLIPAEGLVVFLATNVEEQAAWLREVGEQVISNVLGDGSIRRQATGKDEIHALLARAYFRTMSHGVAWYTRFGALFTNDTGALLRAFQQLRSMTDEERIGIAIEDARQAESQADDPVGGRTYAVAGSFMASMVAQHFGANRLRTYVNDGPFQFALDYVQACGAMECPTGFQFPADMVDALTRWQENWASSHNNTIRNVEIKHIHNATDLIALLDASFRDKSIYPDLSHEILARMEAAERQGDTLQANAFLQIAQMYFSSSAKVALASGERWLKEGQFDQAKRSFRRWSELSSLTVEKQRKHLIGLRRAMARKGENPQAEALREILQHLIEAQNSQTPSQSGPPALAQPTRAESQPPPAASLSIPMEKRAP